LPVHLEHDILVILSGTPGSETVGEMILAGIHQMTPVGAFASANGHTALNSASSVFASDELASAVIDVETSLMIGLIRDGRRKASWYPYEELKARRKGSTAPGDPPAVVLYSATSADKRRVGAGSVTP
jgi:hypothetical protein